MRRRIQDILKITQGENFENLNKNDRKFPSKGKGAFFCSTGGHSKNTHSILKDFKNHILMIREISFVLLYDLGVYFSERFFYLQLFRCQDPRYNHFVTGLTRKKTGLITFLNFQKSHFHNFQTVSGLV